MSDGQQLASTGAGSLVIGGITIANGWWMLGLAVILVGVGIAAIRLGFRARRNAGER